VSGVKERLIGIRQPQTRLSEFLREVKKGATIVVTDHGRRVARIVPEAESLGDRLQALRNAGAILWSGRRLPKTRPVARIRVKRTVADIVVENRE
jgi:prevent-host-death family protein